MGQHSRAIYIAPLLNTTGYGEVLYSGPWYLVPWDWMGQSGRINPYPRQQVVVEGMLDVKGWNEKSDF